MKNQDSILKFANAGIQGLNEIVGVWGGRGCKKKSSKKCKSTKKKSSKSSHKNRCRSSRRGTSSCRRQRHCYGSH